MFDLSCDRKLLPFLHAISPFSLFIAFAWLWFAGGYQSQYLFSRIYVVLFCLSLCRRLTLHQLPSIGRFGKHENFYVRVDIDVAVTLQDILLLNFLIFLKNSQFDSFELQLLSSLLEVWSELFCMHGINNIFLSNCKLIQWCTGPHRVRFYVYVHVYVCVLCLPNLPSVQE